MAHFFTCKSDTAVVDTAQGKIRGYEYDGISIFKGIPYAQAKRFHAPEPVKPWEGVLDATSYGYVCPLLEMSKPNGELLVPHRYWLMREDCQNLNIWTPACDDAKRPVLVWLHGGAYEFGSAIEQVAYEGENMCREGQVVVVSINHRLNILGYCDLSAFGEEYANSGNAGTDDIIAALRWIRDHIASFGGDPENVTLFGQSGGGAKITTLLQTPAADGLYAKGINMSGVIGPHLADCTGSGEELVCAMMKELNILLIKDLETIPYHMLAAAYKKVKPKLQAAGKYIGCRPYVNAFYLGTPNQYGFRKETAQIPLLVGTVYGEFTSFVPPAFPRGSVTEDTLGQLFGSEEAQKLIPLFRNAYPERDLADLLMLDVTFRLPAQQYIRQRAAQNSCTYSYLFNQDLPIDGGRTPWHCADIPYVFHNTDLVPVTQESGVTEKLQQQIFASVMAFAKTGNPNHEGIPFWPESTPEEEHTMIFDTNTRVRCNYDAELIPLAAQGMAAFFENQARENQENIQH